MDSNKKIKWAAVFGFCFLISILIMQSVSRAIATLRSSNDTGFYIHFFFFALPVILFFAMLILHTRGYVRLGEKYNVSALKWTPYIFIYAAGALCVAMLVDIFQTGVHQDVTVANAAIGLITIFYVAGLVAVGLTTIPLRNNLGSVAIWPTAVGTISLIYVIYFFGFTLLGLNPIEFLGSFVWLPIPEGLFVVSGIFLFLRAARD